MLTEKEKSRGYYKIKGAARAFNFDFKNKIVLDIGSSTGGFTQYALEQGAKKVIAIEKGTNQMVKPLRYDEKIDLHEKTDIFSVRTPELSSQEYSQDDGSVVFIVMPDIILADVSFVSLTKILQYVKKNLSNQKTEFLVMFKPQFEARPDQLKTGVIKNEKIRRDIIKKFEYWLKIHNFVIINKHDNNLKGKSGNQERFYYLKLAKK